MYANTDDANTVFSILNKYLIHYEQIPYIEELSKYAKG